MTNARVIGQTKFANMVEKAAANMWPLENFILNLPPDKERYMRTTILEGLDKAKRIEESKFAK